MPDFPVKAEDDLTARGIAATLVLSQGWRDWQYGRLESSALDLTFVPALPRVLSTNVKSKKRTSFIKLLVSLLVLTFANEGAAK